MFRRTAPRWLMENLTSSFTSMCAGTVMNRPARRYARRMRSPKERMVSWLWTMACAQDAGPVSKPARTRRSTLTKRKASHKSATSVITEWIKDLSPHVPITYARRIAFISGNPMRLTEGERLNSEGLNCLCMGGVPFLMSWVWKKKCGHCKKQVPETNLSRRPKWYRHLAGCDSASATAVTGGTVWAPLFEDRITGPFRRNHET